MPVSGENVFRFSGRARKIEGLKGVAIYRVDTAHWMKLNPSGGLILGLVDGRRSVEGIVQELRQRHGFAEDIIREWITGFFSTLVDKGYLEDAAGPPLPAVEPAEDRRLDVLYLHVTGRCNFACPYCYASASRQAPDLDLEVSKRAIAQAAELGAKKLAISGGEPLLRDDLEDILRAGKEAGLMTQLLTNGTLLTRERALSVTPHLDMLQVSIDGWNEETNSPTRGKGTFEQIKKAMLLLRDIGYDRVTAAVTPFAIGEEDIQKFLRLALELEVKMVRFNKLIPAGRAKDLEPERFSGERDMRLADTVYTSYVRLQQEQKADSSPADQTAAAQATGGTQPAFGVKVAGDPANEVMSMTPKAFCGVGVSTLSVACDGTVYPCAALHRPELALGRLMEESLADIHARSVERHCRLAIDREEECRNCDLRHYCGGGCRAVNYALDGRLDGKSPHCEALKRRIMDIFQRVIN